MRPTVRNGRDKRRHERELERLLSGQTDRSSADLLGAYLREVGRYRLLRPEEEISYSRALRRARRELARIARNLPAECRTHALQGRRMPAADRWTLDEIETWYRRFGDWVDEFPTARSLDLRRQAVEQKRELDRARDALVLSNLRLVAHVARKYLNQGVTFMDLIQEGNLGLMRAVEKFEPARGNRFSTYAYWWIKQAVARGIAGKSRVVRLPIHAVETLQRIRRVAAEQHRLTGEAPDARNIAGELDLPPEKVEALLRAGGPTLSLDDPGSGDDDRPLASRVADDGAVSPHRMAERREVQRTVNDALRGLSPREEQVIRLRYGLGSERTHTLEEIGTRIDLSRERVRQLERRAMQKIGACDRARELSERLLVD